MNWPKVQFVELSVQFISYILNKSLQFVNSKASINKLAMQQQRKLYILFEFKI